VKHHRRTLPGVVAVSAAVFLAACAPATAVRATSPPQDGRYDGQLCVTIASTRTNCGPVAVELSNGTQAQVRISDITYQLWLYPSRLNAVLMHGSMQIHEFESAYAWQGQTLQFIDSLKNARYELKFVDRQP